MCDTFLLGNEPCSNSMTFFSPAGLSYLELVEKNLFWRTMHLDAVCWQCSDATTFAWSYWAPQEKDFRFKEMTKSEALWFDQLFHVKITENNDRRISRASFVRSICITPKTPTESGIRELQWTSEWSWKSVPPCDWWESHWSDPLNSMASDGIFFFIQHWSDLQIGIVAAQRLFRTEIFFRSDEFDLQYTWTSSDSTLWCKLWRFPSQTNGSVTDS